MESFKRKALEWLRNWKGSNNRKPLILRGARQVGKTTLAYSIIPKDAKVLEINGDNTDVQTMFVNVDEAQKIENVRNMLKIVAEKFKDVKIIVTGSSAFKLEFLM